MRILSCVGTLFCLCLTPPAFADPFFLPKVDIETPTLPRAVEIGDVTNDGIPDLVVSHDYVDGNDSIGVYRGVGDGTFLPKVTSPVFIYPSRFRLGNFDADTLVDVALPNSGSLWVGHGDGQGHFGNYSFSFSDYGPITPGRVDMGYINADTNLDLVVANDEYDHDSVYVYLGNGDGTFQIRAFATPNGGSQVAMGDITGDGALDLVLSTSYCCPFESHLSYLAGGGDGSFEPWVPIFVCGDEPRDVALADLNGDGKLDIVTACINQICISINQGSGTFTSLTSLPAKTVLPGPSLVVRDLDRDGKADIANAVDSVFVYKGHGDGTFDTSVPYDVVDPPMDLASGDLNGDDQVDLVTVSPVDGNIFNLVPGYLSVLMNCIPCGTTAIAVALQDVRVETGLVRLEWIVPEAGTSISTVYRRTFDTDWVELGEASVAPGGVVTFEDHSVEAGARYAYKLLVIGAGDQGYSREVWVNVPGAAPIALHLEPAHPNPFGGETHLAFSVPGNGRAVLSIYDVHGRRVAKLVDEVMAAGSRTLAWNGRNSSGLPVSSGTYFAKLESGDRREVRKLIVAR